MNHTANIAADLLLEKQSGLLRSAYNAIKTPFVGTGRSAGRQMGPMTRSENFIASNVSQSGMGRDAYNEGLRKWWSNPKNKQMAEEYMRSSPKATPLATPMEGMVSNRKAWTEGLGRYANRGTLESRINAQRLKDLESSFSGFGGDAKYLSRLENLIQKTKSKDMGSVLPTLGGSALGAYQGSDGGLEGMAYGAALGGLGGYGASKGLSHLRRGAVKNQRLKNLYKRRSEVLQTHDKNLLGQKANYAGRRTADWFTQKGRYNTLGERMRFGRLGGGHLFGDKGEEVAARAMQGGVFGKGGLIRGALAVDPRLSMNAKMTRQALASGDYGAAARYGAATAGRGAMHGGKLGLMAGMPAWMVYSDVTGENPENKSFGERLGKSLGSNAAMMATFPLGLATWAPGMALGEEYSLPGQVSKLTGAIGGAFSSGGPPAVAPPLPPGVSSQYASAQPARQQPARQQPARQQPAQQQPAQQQYLLS